MDSWGKRKDGQPYIKFKKPTGMSGAGQKTSALDDVHYKEREGKQNIMEAFDGAEIITPVSELGIWMVWFGGESHYVHIYDENGKELDVFSWGFEKNRLDANDVKKHIKDHIEEMTKKEFGEREDYFPSPYEQ